MDMNRYLKSVVGACIGAGMAGFWLVVDLLTPEPWGDFILFGLMAVVNLVIGWQVAKLFGKSRRRTTADSRIDDDGSITDPQTRNART